jgi:4-hydroxybenzoate polyprenyltransferase
MVSQPDTAAAPLQKGVLIAAIKALRPHQWSKNVLLFAALIFSRNFQDAQLWLETITGFAAFCMLSSTGYLFNDVRDKAADAHHPTKRHRPIASGRLPIRVAYAEMALVFVLGLALSFWVSGQHTMGEGVVARTPWFLVVALLYFANTISYSLFFKSIVIVDVMMIAAGFLWRAAAGAVAIGVTISPWLLLCTAFLALFLGFNKRRGEQALLVQVDVGKVRKSLQEYTPELIMEFQAITTSGTVISYALYTVLGSDTPWLLLTLPFVLYGLFRYMYLVRARGEGAAPDETLFKDKPILITCILYAITAVAVLFLVPRGE